LNGKGPFVSRIRRGGKGMEEILTEGRGGDLFRELGGEGRAWKGF